MPDREYPGAVPRELEDPVVGAKAAPESPLPGLDTMLRDAADDATRRAIVPPYDVVQGLARRRRTATVATAGVFGVVVFLVIGVVAVTGAEPYRSQVYPRPAASATLDPSLRGYWTDIPILSWTPDAGREVFDVSGTNEFRTAVFSALGSQEEYDLSVIKDFRTLFPDAPVGGPVIAIDQSFTTAEVERAAANLRALDGVQDARVIVVPGLWFTVSATGPADLGTRYPTEINLEGTGVRGSAGGRRRDAQNRWVDWVRATYIGPAIDRATFDLLRARAAEAVRIDVSQVVVTAESTARGPGPTTS